MRKRAIWVSYLPENSSEEDSHWLRPCTPIGVGTRYVEALTGYITRLAELHWMTVTPFMHDVLESFLPEQFRFKYKMVRTNQYLINGYGRFAQRISQAVTNATSAFNASHLTFTPWQNAFDPQGHGLLRDHLCWCKSCWREDTNLGISPYVRLSWVSQQVSICTLHDRALEHFCYHCGASQNVMPTLPLPWMCQRCGLDLREGRVSKKLKKRGDKQNYWAANTVERLIERSCAIGRSIDQNKVAMVLRDICEAEFEGDSYRFSKEVNIRQPYIWRWMDGSSKPTFPSFLDLSYRLGVPPDGLLLSENRPIIDIRPSRIRKQRVFVEMRKLTEHEKKRMSAVLNRVIREEAEPPPLLSEVAKEIGVSVAVIKYHFANKAEIIKKRSDDWRNMIRTNRELERIERALDGANELIRMGIYPSERRLREFSYVRPSDLRRPEILKALRELQDQHSDLPTK